MANNKTAIICCAGMGTRLGIGTTKALVDINGQPLILHQLRLLDEIDDVRIVVGYQAQKVIDIVNSYRRDLMFCFNYDYINTGTASSFCKGLVGAKEYVISIDGDVLFHPDDFKRFISKEDECIAGCSPEISDPVYMKLDDGVVSEFSRENGDVQWAGLAIMDVNRIVPDENHIYQILERMLPMKYMLIRSQEINTIGDYEKAIRWQANGYER